VILKQSGLSDFENIFDVLYENAKWLEGREIVQWPLAWLESKRDEIKASVAAGDFYQLDINNNAQHEANSGISAIVELKSCPEEIWASDKAKALYIHKLAIRRIHKNQDLGRTVLSLIKEDAIRQKLTYLRLDCVAHNVALRAYYEEQGFILIEEVSTPEVVLALYQLEL
jgi:ribosomal protein S18 acetylase RimI-like enzyme